MSMPIDDAMSMPIDEAMSMSFDEAMSMSLIDEAMSFPLSAMSMPYTCDSTYSCPTDCDCGGNVQDGGDICGCYSITSVTPPFDTTTVTASGTWYCYQVDLDKSVDGCSGAKAVSHSVLATGFSESCLFHPGGLDADGSDNWSDHTCDNTAATGLKFDFGHSGEGDQLSVTYCFDVSCEAAPAGEGSINWVLKAANDRCEIVVTEGAVPNCGISSDLCHPSCPSTDGGSGGGGSNNGAGPPEATTSETPESQTKAAPTVEAGSKNVPAIAGSLIAVAAVAAAAGIVHRVVSTKNAAAAEGDGASLSSVDTPLA